ncbi:MAG TPA: hypothetical protein VK668_05010 [Mucilaginibacter sp.]|nr:hypothetical protein [Mucilaginibacter sp.]
MMLINAPHFYTITYYNYNPYRDVQSIFDHLAFAKAVFNIKQQKNGSY